MAFTSVGTLGSALSSGNNQSSLAITTSAAAAAGTLVVVAVAVDNDQTTDGDATQVSGVTDSGGNVWTRGKEFANGQGTAQTGAEIAIWYSVLTNPIANGGTITAAFTSATTADASAMSAWNYTKAPGTSVVVEGTPGGLANDAANAGSLDVTTANIPCLRFRAIASESNSSTALINTASWTLITQAISGAGTSATEMGVRGEWIISTGTGAASAPTGGAGAVDQASAYVAFKEVQTAPPTNNSSEVGSQVAAMARKAVTATLIAASAGSFLPPYPTVQAAPAVAATLDWQQPLSIAPRTADAIYTQPNLVGLPPQAAPTGWQQALSIAPRVAAPQQGASFVPFDTAQVVPAVAASGIPLDMGGAAPRYRTVYFQSRFETPYQAPVVVVAAAEGWQAPLSGAPPVAKAQVGYASVPYNTAQLSVNFTNFGWHGPTATAPPVAKAQAGSSFVPYNTAQVVVSSYTNIGWYQPLSGAPAVAKARQGDSYVPFNTAQVVAAVAAPGIPLDMGGAAPRIRQVYYQQRFVPPDILQTVVATAVYGGWYSPLSTAAPIANAPVEQWQLPYSVAPVVSVGWQQPLSRPPQVAKSPPGHISGPFSPASTVTLAWQAPLSVAPVVKRTIDTNYQLPVYPGVVVIANTVTIDKWQQPLSVAPKVAQAQQGDAFVPYNTAQVVVAAYTKFYLQPLSVAVPVARAISDFGSVPLSSPAVITVDKWQQPLSKPVGVAQAQAGFSSVPFNTAQLAVNYTAFTWSQPLSLPPPVAQPQVGWSFVPFNTAQAAPAGIAGMAWYSQLGTVPYSVVYQPQQYPVDPPRFGEIAPSPPEETGTILMPGKAGGGGFTRKRWREILEEEAAQRRAILEDQKAARDEAARVKAIAQEARAAKIVARAEASSSQARLNDVVRASETAKAFAEQSSKEEAAFLAAMLAEIANQEDEDEAIMLLVGF